MKAKLSLTFITQKFPVKSRIFQPAFHIKSTPLLKRLESYGYSQQDTREGLLGTMCLRLLSTINMKCFSHHMIPCSFIKISEKGQLESDSSSGAMNNSSKMEQSSSLSTHQLQLILKTFS